MTTFEQDARRGKLELVAGQGETTARSFDLDCSSCGYGVVVRIAPLRCPMCGGSAWEHSAQPRSRRLASTGERPEAA